MFFKAKKLGISDMVALSLLAASCGAYAETGTLADSATAQVNITATVVGQTCTPSWSASSPVSVDLGKVSDTSMTAEGDIGALKPFTLTLTDCATGISKVSVMSAGTPDSNDTSAFANLTSGNDAATGVAVSLFGGEDQSTQLTPAGNSVDYGITNGAADMVFLAKLERTSGTINDGAFQTTTTFYMTYE